jgi:hypothetical protein
MATLAQNKIFHAKQELLLSEITGLPLDAQMQRNRLDVDERVEGSKQCSCSRPSWLARAARSIQVLQMQHLQGIHMYGGGSDAHRTARSASATRREHWQRGCYVALFGSFYLFLSISDSVWQPSVSPLGSGLPMMLNGMGLHGANEAQLFV